MEVSLQSIAQNSNRGYANYDYEVRIKQVMAKDFLLIMLILLAILSVPNMPLNFNNSATSINWDNGVSHASLLPEGNTKITALNVAKSSKTVVTKENFLEFKQLSISKFLIQSGVSSTCFLDEASTSKLHNDLSDEFLTHLKSLKNIEDSQLIFFKSKEHDLLKLALEMQQKYQIPASVILAKAILQSEWGKYVYEYNVFQKVEGHDLKDYKNYQSAFSDFANSISNDANYAALFTAGKDYKKWTSLLGSIECNTSVFSPEKDCYNKMEVLISTYHLDLLDY